MWCWAVIAQAADLQPVELTLDEALQRLTSDAPAYQQARARAESARGLARQSAAAWLPIVVANGSYTRNDNEVILDFSESMAPLEQMFADLAPMIQQFDPDFVAPDFPDTEPVVIQPLDVWNANATVRVPLLAPSAWADTRSAYRGARGAEASVAEIRQELELGLISAAASVEAASGLVEAAQQAVGVSQAHLDSTRVAVAVGTATQVDVLAAEADVARRRSELVQAEASLAKGQDGLGALLGIDGPARVTLPEGNPPAHAAQPRPALTASQAQIDSARARVSSAWWRHVPTVSATATGLLASVPFPTGNEWAYRLGVEASWTLYDGGLRYGRLHQARADLAAANAFHTQEELRMSRELRDAQRDLDVAKEQLVLAEEQAKLAREAASVAQRGLEAGTTSPLQARDVESQAFSADVGVVAARARLRIAWATWQRAQGLDQRW
jgi:outer membrane protein TolC